MASEAHEREKLERLCRYITHPAVSTERLSLTTQGKIRYRLKAPYWDDTTEVVFEPLDLMAHFPVRHPTGDLRSSKLAGLPICHGPAGGTGADAARQPRATMGCSRRTTDLREQITPARRGRRKAETTDEPAPARHVSMNLKRNI